MVPEPHRSVEWRSFQTGMIRYIAKRAFLTVAMVWLLLTLVFLLAHVVPGDPARLVAGPKASQASLASIRKQLGLDRSLLVQYARFATRLLQGGLGVSYVTRRGVADDLHEFLPATLELTLAAMLVAVPAGILLGVLVVLRPGSTFDHAVRVASVAACSLSPFVVAISLQLLLYYKLGWLPFGERLGIAQTAFPSPTGFLLLDALRAGRLDAAADVLWHLAMPAMVLALQPFGMIARVTRASMLEVSHSEFVVAARARGLREGTIMLKHAFRVACLPVLTMVAMQFGWLLGGVVLVEFVFNWPGMGRYLAKALVAVDYNAIVAAALIIGVAYALLNAGTDILYALLDPRITYT